MTTTTMLNLHVRDYLYLLAITAKHYSLYLIYHRERMVITLTAVNGCVQNDDGTAEHLAWCLRAETGDARKDNCWRGSGALQRLRHLPEQRQLPEQQTQRTHVSYYCLLTCLAAGFCLRVTTRICINVLWDFWLTLSCNTRRGMCSGRQGWCPKKEVGTPITKKTERKYSNLNHTLIIRAGPDF